MAFKNLKEELGTGIRSKTRMVAGPMGRDRPGQKGSHQAFADQRLTQRSLLSPLPGELYMFSISILGGGGGCSSSLSLHHHLPESTGNKRTATQSGRHSRKMSAGLRRLLPLEPSPQHQRECLPRPRSAGAERRERLGAAEALAPAPQKAPACAGEGSPAPAEGASPGQEQSSQAPPPV